MNVSDLIASIDSEINRLKQVRSLLNGIETGNRVKDPPKPPWRKAHSER